MILTLNKNNRGFASVAATLLLAFLLVPHTAFSQNALSLSVTPTLFEMSANPLQVWESSVKVINSNSFDIEVYADVVNFAPEGEAGRGKLIPVFEDLTEGATLAEWIDITEEPITVPRESSVSVPFIVEVPEDASPGGHFAAILISTRPPQRQQGELFVSTTQIVTSLFFVRVAGDVTENGAIRSFTTADRFVETPGATFELRFENKGNVHLQPRGEITIFNMWGKERGTIPINHKTHFGNVLPESIRKFEFSWTGEPSFSDFGRYRAVASLGYGMGEKQFATSTTYFWVIPIKPLLITLGLLLSFVLFLFWAVKLYVRRMLQLSGVPVDTISRTQRHPEHPAHDGDVRIASYRSFSAPMRSGYMDLRGRLAQAGAFLDVLRALLSFVRAYKWFFVSAIVLLLGAALLYVYVTDAMDSERSYEVTIENPDTSLDLSSEEIRYEEAAGGRNLPSIGQLGTQAFALDLVNTSGKVGTAAREALRFAELGYGISSIRSGEGRVDKTSVIVFDPALQEEAVSLSRELGGALLSARTATSSEEQPNITVFVGSDRLAE